MGWIVSPLNNLYEKRTIQEKKVMEANFVLQHILLCCLIPFGMFFVPKEVELFSLQTLFFFIFLFFALWQEFFRRLCFAKKKYWLSLLSDSMRYLLPMVIIWFMNPTNLSEVFLIFILSSFLSILTLMINFEVKSWFLLCEFKNSFRHWKMAKWLVGSAVLQWFAANYILILVAQVIGPAATGMFKVCQTILGASHVFIKSIESVVPFSASGELHKKGLDGLDNVVRKTSVVYGLSMLCFCLIPYIFAPQILGWINENVNAEEIYLLEGFSVYYFLGFFVIPLHIGLKALEVTRPIFVSLVILSVLNYLCADFFVVGYGLKGAIVGLIFLKIIELIYMGYCFWSARKKYSVRIKVS
jgi:O-antigen/teichoic acid export membrane protein